MQEGGFVKCWGLNDYGQLGYGDTIQRGDNANEMGASTPSHAGGLVGFAKVYLPTVDLAGTAVRIELGEQHSCALLVSGPDL
ncbi:hypothetical protein T484DRAFT_1871935 [Baffinella frigidus]|nr:hypothetical protein T484DRAFT_1871935 [Cryptophyta sp. CCMP2293]